MARNEPAPSSRAMAERVVAWSVVAAVTAFVVWQLHPELLLRDTTPTQGDLGSHLHEPAHLRDNLLPHGRLSGWSQDWFTGYPSLTFYFPLGSLLVVVLDLLLPYKAAFKVIAALGPMLLPLCAYAFGRLEGRDRLTAASFAVAVLPLLLEPTLLVAGGSVGAAGVGEYSFGLSLAAGLLALGVARAGLRTGRHRAAAAVLFAATLLLHLIPAFVYVAGLVVSTAMRFTWAKVRWTASVLAVAVALAGFWIVPFVLRGPFTAGPDYPRMTAFLKALFPVGMAPVALVAVVGLAVGVLVAAAGTAKERDDLRAFLVAMALLSALVFAVTPSGRVWNGRFLALWFLWVCLLAGSALAYLARAVDDLRRQRSRGQPVEVPNLARMVLPVVVLVAVLPVWDSRLGRGALTRTQVNPIDTARASFEGYERSPFRAEYQGFIDMVRKVAREEGCGRAHWVLDEGGWADQRSPLQRLIPYWTDGCITVTEGLFTQSSATAPFIHVAHTRLSSEPVVLHDQREFDVAAGIEDLRVLGARYLILSRLETIEAADDLPALRAIARTPPVDGAYWKIYEVSDSELVEPLGHEPVVVRGVGRSRSSWESAVRRWYDGGKAREVVVAADGPDAWPRRDVVGRDPPRRSTGSTTVSRVRIEDDRISFRVSRPGVPVLVKVSYFPNWKASGAEGPWRVTPNQMVVVPTSTTVTLHYGRTAVDHAGWLATLVGVGGLVIFARTGPAPAPPSPPAEEPSSEKGRRPVPRKKRRT